MFPSRPHQGYLQHIHTQYCLLQALHGSPAFNAQFMKGIKLLHDAEKQLALGWQAYELFKKGQINPEDKDIDDMLRIWEESVNS